MLGSRAVSQEPGQLVASKYRLERPLARGGMGSVWVARHVELDVDVALKFRRFEDDVELAVEHRFKREAQAAAQLRGPHIVHIHDYGVHQGTPYIAMELLPGEDLGQRLDREGTMSLALALGWLRQAAKALRVVHTAGIVHRDIKPSNLFLAEQQGETVLKMLDFGIAKTPNEGGGATTSAGLLLGSPAYMSPEQARGQRVDARSDLWSLAAVLYRMLTGRAPFEGASSGDILVRLCTEDVKPPSSAAPHLAPEVDRFFQRALAREPDRRFQDVDELLAEAEELAGLPGSAFDVERAAPSTQSSPQRSAEGSLGRSTPTASLRVPLPAGERTLSSDAPSRDTSTLPSRASQPSQPSPSSALPSLDGAEQRGASERVEEARRSASWFSVLGVASIVALGGGVLWWWSEGPEPKPPLTSTSVSTLSNAGDTRTAVEATSLSTGSLPGRAPGPGATPGHDTPGRDTPSDLEDRVARSRDLALATTAAPLPAADAPSPLQSAASASRSRAVTPPASTAAREQTQEPRGVPVPPPADPVFGLPLQERAPDEGTP